MLNSSKKIYLDGNVIHDKKVRAGISPGNNAVDLGKWIEKSVESGAIDLTTVISNIVGNTSSISLNDLTDVTISTPADRSNLTYYSTINKFVASPITNITEGTLQVASGDRVIDLGTNALTIDNVNTLTINSSGTNQITTDNGSTLSRVRTTANYAYLYAQTNIYSSQVSAHDDGSTMLYSNFSKYRIGNSSSTIPPTYLEGDFANYPRNITINPFNQRLYTIDTAAVFISFSSLITNTPKLPTVSEVKTYLTSFTAATRISNMTRYFYFNGTNDSTITPTHIYYITGDEQIVEVYNARPKKYLTIPMSKTSITSADVGSVIGSIAIPHDYFYASAGGFITQTSISSIKGSTSAAGINDITFDVKDGLGVLLNTFSYDAYLNGSWSPAGFPLSSTNSMFYIEPVTVNGTIDGLCITFEIQ